MADAAAVDITGIAFRNPSAAAQNLARIAERVSAGIFRVLGQLLGESPDPDSSLNLFERLTNSGADEIFRQLERHQFLLHYTLAVFGCSAYLGETLIQNHDLFHAMLREKSLDHTHSRDEFAESFARFRTRSLDVDTSLLLARFKRREYVRIMLRDVLRIATLAETTSEISALSDVLIQEALRDTDQQLRNRYGPPQHLDRAGRLVDTAFTVLSLGKLGGNELNYSSDIDLLFLYADGDEPPGAQISNREYFIRLAQELTGVLSRMTREGAPFRIDLRLRPQGGEGEPAVGLSHALEYYAHRAADWELQAMIKLRHSAGDQALAREFIRRIHPFVYTEELNFAAIETALATREKIGRRRRHAVATRKAEGIDVKLDRGGIRDIEFLVQCLQRVYGGAELWLRSGGTLFSLQKLHDKGHISGKEFNSLTVAYEFLRTIEHRLQLRHGQQTHRLPTTDAELLPIARMASGPEVAPGEFLALVQKRMSAVAEIYSRIIHQQQVSQERGAAEFLRTEGDSREEAHRQLVSRLAVESPGLYQLLQRPDVEGHTRRNLYRFLTSASTSSERYAAITSAAETVERALPLFSYSDYLTDVLARHPDQIFTLREIQEGNRAQAESSPGLHEGALADMAELSHAEKLALLRRQFRTRTFAAAARDVLDPRSVYESLTEITRAADEAICAAAEIAGVPDGFAIFALGRLGTCEHDLLSDADLLFVRDEEVDPVMALRSVERLMAALSAYTKDGAVFPVDARLRPHGGEGELVITPGQLESYFAREAQPWEALTYTKLRYLAGAREVAARTASAVNVLNSRFAGDAKFTAALLEMRGKLEKTTEDFDEVKSGPGGVYDIDFIVGGLQVRHGVLNSAGNLRQRLRQLCDRSLLAEEDWKRLDRHAQLLRTVEHVIRLVVGKSRKTLPVAGPARAACEALCRRILKREFPEGLDITVRFALVGVRDIYRRVLE